MAQVTLRIPAFTIEVTCSGESEGEVLDWIGDNYIKEIGSKAFEGAKISEATYDEPDKEDTSNTEIEEEDDF